MTSTRSGLEFQLTTIEPTLPHTARRVTDAVQPRHEEREPRMDEARFDEMARGLDSRLTRRRAGGLAAGALLALGLAAESDAKKKKKKKKKKKGGTGGTGGSGVNFSCGNLGAPCGNTLICQCRLNKNSQQVCMNIVTPPNGISFPPCQSQANCPAGTFCDLQFSQCASACAN
jgi:hypothetical protein